MESIHSYILDSAFDRIADILEDLRTDTSTQETFMLLAPHKGVTELQ